MELIDFQGSLLFVFLNDGPDPLLPVINCYGHRLTSKRQMQNIVCSWQTGALTTAWHTGAVEQSECKIVLARMARRGSHKSAGAGNVGAQAVMDLPDA